MAVYLPKPLGLHPKNHSQIFYILQEFEIMQIFALIPSHPNRHSGNKGKYF